MRVTVRLDFGPADSSSSASALEGSSSSARDNFWKEYSRRNSGDAYRVDGEGALREKFASKLRKYVVEMLNESAREARSSHSRSTFPTLFPFSGKGRVDESLSASAERIEIRLIDIQYGSIEFILSVLGIDGETARRVALEAIAAYSPIAFNQSLGGTAAMHADVRAPVVPEGLGNGASTLGILSTSLLVPCVLALAVWFIAYNALTKELTDIRAERTAMSQQQTETLKVLVDQHAKMSAMLMEATKGATATASELEQQQLALVRLGALSEGLLKDSAPPGPTAEVKPKAQ